MNASATPMETKGPQMPVALRPKPPGAGGIRRSGVWNTAQGRRESQKVWRNIKGGFEGLQPLEIPQNRQSFLWKSLDENMLDLEKLGELQSRPALFRHRLSGCFPHR